MIYFLIGSLVLNLTLTFVVVNLLRITEKQEDAIKQYLDSTINILNEARALDERQMFEKDDEVGSLFQNLLATIGDLRLVIIGEPDDETKS